MSNIQKLEQQALKLKNRILASGDPNLANQEIPRFIELLNQKLVNNEITGQEYKYLRDIVSTSDIVNLQAKSAPVQTRTISTAYIPNDKNQPIRNVDVRIDKITGQKTATEYYTDPKTGEIIGKKKQIEVPKEYQNPESSQTNVIQNTLGRASNVVLNTTKSTLKSPTGMATVAAGITSGAWAAVRLKLQRDLRKALENNDIEEAQRIQQKIRKLNRIALLAGVGSVAGSAMLGAYLSKKQT